MKPIVMLASLVVAAFASGCASFDVHTDTASGNGGYQGEDILQQMARDSEAGDA